MTITSIWYKKEHHAIRVGYVSLHAEREMPKLTYSSFWITMNAMAQVIGSVLMYGVGKLQNPTIAPWRILFLICGALTTASGVLFYLAMPATPHQAWFLTSREKKIVLTRMEQDREGGDKTKLSIHQVKETVLDLKAWFVLAFGILITLPSPVIIVSQISPHYQKQ